MNTDDLHLTNGKVAGTYQSRQNRILDALEWISAFTNSHGYACIV